MARTDDSLIAKQAEVTQREQAGQPAFDPVEAALPEPLVAVPVRDEAPAQAIPRCVQLSASNPIRALLPQDPRRRRAVVLAVDNDVWVTPSTDLAAIVQAGTTGSDGFYLPKGVPLVITAKAAFYVTYTALTSGIARVSVLVEKDDE